MATLILNQQEIDKLTAQAAASGMTAGEMLKKQHGDDVEIIINTPPVNNPDLDFLFVETDKVQGEVEKLIGLGTEMMDCPECGGKGDISGGSLGNMCVACDGSGTVTAPFAEKFDIPDMAAFRRELQAAEKTMKLGGKVDLLALKGRLEEMTATAKETANIIKARLAPAPSRAKAKLPGRRQPALAPRDLVDEVLDDHAALRNGEDDGEED